MIQLTHQTTIFCPVHDSQPVQYALKVFCRDLEQILGQPLTIETHLSPHQIRLTITPDGRSEGFRLWGSEADNVIAIEGSDELGLVFGMYSFCERWLGIDPYAFWTEFEYRRRPAISLPVFDYTSPSPKVRFRGWFINDEDCLMGWHDEMQISLVTWERIFETILRAGYNMVIPGTGRSVEEPHVRLASDMGLWITQHHAEPLGAEMFTDVYPGVAPRIPEELDRFTQLYRKAITRYAGMNVVWALGFRGQGDSAFFRDDPRYETPERQGALIGQMIRLQKQLITEMCDGPQQFVHNIYAESAGLYRDGHLALDDDIIRVWADNGFGAMRMRRKFCQPEPHVSSLPLPDDRQKRNGVYYHVSFHDLHISNKLVPLVNPNLVREQFDVLFEAGHIEYLTLNVSNIRPHIFHIELVNRLCRFPDNGSGDPVQDHYAAWTQRHFPGHEGAVAHLLQRYYTAPFVYDDAYPDDARAGEEVYHHGLRRAIQAAIKQQADLAWFAFIPNHPDTREGCVRWLLERAEGSLPAWESLSRDADTLLMTLSGRAARFFQDAVQMPIAYMQASCQGFVSGLQGVLAYQAQEYESAFCAFSQSKRSMQAAWHALQATEHGKWLHFYRGEWLVDTRETLRHLETVLGLCKLLGDTDDWRSHWMMTAMNLRHRTIQTMIQATADYDRLADALLDRRNTGSQDERVACLR
jgi:hypothetical protein